MPFQAFLPVCIFIFLCFTPLRLFQLFIAIMAMIRAIKIDHGTNSECSLFGIHIVLYWDGPLGGIFGHFACFQAYFLEFKTGFGQWLQLMNNFADLNDILVISLQFSVSANLKVVHIGPKHVHIGHVLVQTTPRVG